MSSESAAKKTQAEKEKNIREGSLGRVVRGDVWERVTWKQRVEDAVPFQLCHTGHLVLIGVQCFTSLSLNFPYCN